MLHLMQNLWQCRCHKLKSFFIPKNTTSRLQPLEGGIIQNFKVNYGKNLVKYALARINENLHASEIAKDVNILTAIRWSQDDWRDVSNTTIKSSEIVKSNDDIMEVEEEELEGLVLESSSNISRLREFQR